MKRFSNMAKRVGIAAPAMTILILGTAILVSGCDILGLKARDDGQTGSLRLNVVGILAGSRTVVTDPNQITIDSYTITLESHDGYPTRNLSASTNVTTVSDLELGTWDIKVDALRSFAIVGHGEALNQVITASDPLSVTISLSMTQDGTGGFSLPVTFPTSTGIDYVRGTLSELDGTVVGSPLVPDITTAGDENSCVFSMNDIPSGAYILSMDFRRGGEAGTPAGVFGEAVNIWDSVVSDKWVDSATGLQINKRSYQEIAFFSSNTSLGGLGLTDARGAVSISPGFSSSITSYEAITNSSSISFTVTPSLGGQFNSFSVDDGMTWVDLNLSMTTVTITSATQIVYIRTTAPDGVSTKDISIFLKKGYSITYDENGSAIGSPPVDASVYSTGDSVIVLSGMDLGRPGYSMASWNMDPNGTGESFNVGDSLTMGEQDITLYATWVISSIVYNSNGSTSGTVPTDSTVYSPSSVVTISTNTGNLCKDGYQFAGWMTAPDGSGSSYAEGSTLVYSGQLITLYAIWIPSEMNFTSTGNDIVLTSLTKSITDLVVPDGVTRIGQHALENAVVLSVVIPQSVRCIDSYAFYMNPYLQQIDIAPGLTTIADHAFYRCCNLHGGISQTSIALPETVTTIGEMAFAECPSLSITANNLTNVGSMAFLGCAGDSSISIAPEANIAFEAFYQFIGLRNVTLPSSIASIGNYAFNGCSGLTSIVIPDGYTTLPAGCFQDCTGLVSVSFPETFVSIPYRAFQGCINLDIQLPISLRTIDPFAFDGCASLKLIDIPAGVRVIPDHAFTNCSTVTCIEIPQGVTSIGPRAFAGCSNVISVSIPSSVIEIAVGQDSSFGSTNASPSRFVEISVDPTNPVYQTINGALFSKDGSVLYQVPHGLTSFNIPSSARTIYDYATSFCANLMGVSIPQGVTSIGFRAFWMNLALESIVIPESVLNMGNEAFLDCKALVACRMGGATPPALNPSSSLFRNVDNVVLYVPLDGLSDYLASPGWATCGYTRIETY